MRVIVQRCKYAKVTIDGKLFNEINQGFMLLVGFTEGDNEAIIDKLAKKVANLRVFTDSQDKMNLALKDVQGDILSISQFTLYADCKKGNRPSFTEAMGGEKAEPLYHLFNEKLRAYQLVVKEGIFGADMKVELLNDGPVTIILDSEKI